MNYRLYVLDAAGRIAKPSIELQCADDDEAIRHAKQYIDGAPVEIWQGTKLVARLEPDD